MVIPARPEQYDNEDTVCGLIYGKKSSPEDAGYVGEIFFFMKNLQGDIIAITDQNGRVVAKYAYDAWGKCTIVEDTSERGIAAINPYRYRGYYYDSEIGMYYLQSRYYDPVVGRFVNGDDTPVVVLSLLIHQIALANLFSYCGNAPTNDKDLFGGLSEKQLFAMLDPLSVYKMFMIALCNDFKNGLLAVAAYATKIFSPIAIKTLWWKPLVAAALVLAAVALVVAAVAIIYNAKTEKGKTKIPSKLKSGDKVKTPTSHKGEFTDSKGGKYTHKKTKWKYEKSRDGHYGGEHWHAYPENAKTGDYYNISFDGRVLG